MTGKIAHPTRCNSYFFTCILLWARLFVAAFSVAYADSMLNHQSTGDILRTIVRARVAHSCHHGFVDSRSWVDLATTAIIRPKPNHRLRIDIENPARKPFNGL